MKKIISGLLLSLACIFMQIPAWAQRLDKSMFNVDAEPVSEVSILVKSIYNGSPVPVKIAFSGKERDAHICVYIQDSTGNWETEPRIDLKGILNSDGFDEWEFGYGWTMYRSREIFRFPDENPSLTGGISGYVTVAFPEISISDIWRSDAVKNGKAFSHTIQDGDMIRLNASDIGQRSALAVSSDFVYTAE